jgi:hypothetical protein
MLRQGKDNGRKKAQEAQKKTGREFIASPGTLGADLLGIIKLRHWVLFL